MPTLIISTWLLGLFSFALVGGAIYMLYEWYQRAWEFDPDLNRRIFEPDFGLNGLTMLLLGGILLLVLSLAGRLLLPLFLGQGRSRDADFDPPRKSREGEVQRLQRPDGTELQVEFYGPEDGLPIVLSHGWGMNSTEWHYLKGELTDRFRLIVWDEPGLGLSTQPSNRDYSLEKMARDLEAVLGLAGRPAVLLGHSIGGMITQTFCRLFPDALGDQVKGLVLTHTTYTNPVRTVKGAPFFTALERPVIMPLLHLTIWLSPLVWLMNLTSYLNGSAHLMTKWTSFAGGESWEQIEFATRYQLHASPAVVARGMIGMIHYDATDSDQRINVPVLIIPGDQDPLCPPTASATMHELIPNSKLRPLSPARHLGLIEHHSRYAEMVREFGLLCLQERQPAGANNEPQGRAQRRR
jgi:pimeloyl-ACP methyl ester carboxylesterase